MFFYRVSQENGDTKDTLIVSVKLSHVFNKLVDAAKEDIELIEARLSPESSQPTW